MLAALQRTDNRRARPLSLWRRFSGGRMIGPLSGCPWQSWRGVVEDYVREYLEGFEDKLVQLGVAIADHDSQQVKTFGHRLKGTGGTYGFPVLSEIGGEIESTSLRLLELQADEADTPANHASDRMWEDLELLRVRLGDTVARLVAEPEDALDES